MNQQLLDDIGGTIHYDPTETTGRPSSAFVTLYKPGGTSHQAEATATIDAVNTTISAATAGATTVTVASATGIVVGRSYLLSNSDGQHERIVVTRTDAAVVHLMTPLEYAYEATSPFVGQRVTYVITTALAATRGLGYQALWRYVIATVTYRVRTHWDVVRSIWPAIILTGPRFQAIAGRFGRDIIQRVGREGRDFADEIADATLRVREDLLAREAKPHLFLGTDAFERPIALRVLRDLAATGGLSQGFDAELFEHLAGEYDRGLESAIRSTQTYDADDNLAVSEDEQEAHPAPMRLYR